MLEQICWNTSRLFTLNLKEGKTGIFVLQNFNSFMFVFWWFQELSEHDISDSSSSSSSDDGQSDDDDEEDEIIPEENDIDEETM